MAEQTERAETAEKAIFYEMLWDCAQCNTKGLLGTSQRHCPVCGAAQDPKKRYFPKEGEEVEAKNHRFAGVDWHCGYCNTPNSAAADFCTNCGAGKDGTKPVELIVEKLPEPVPKSTKMPSWLVWSLGLFGLFVVVMLSLFFSKHEVTATVAARNWQREIQIERLMPVSESAWCDSVPSGAYGMSRSQEVRSTNKIPNGQDCHEVRQDKGDGSFVKHTECTTRYREEPVYSDRCHYQIKRWQPSRKLKADNLSATNSGNNLAPTWPSASLNPSALGGERIGAKSENYELTFKRDKNDTSDNKKWTCNVSEAVWNKYQNGNKVTIKVRATGGMDCSTL
jgi:hypothetical protein